MPKRCAFLLASLYLTYGSLHVFAQQFSADMVRLKPQGAAPSKVFVSGDRMRLEAGSAQHTSVVIVDLKQQTGFMVLPDSKRYTMLQPGRISAAMPLLNPTDPDNACPAWEQAIGKPGTCTKVGSETVSGRDTVKYKGTAQNGDTGSLWLDRKLKFVIKWEGQLSASELRNIKTGPQAADLFRIPKEFEQMDSKASRQESSRQGARKAKPTPIKPKN